MPDNGSDNVSGDVTIDEIIASAAEARRRLGELEHGLQGEIDHIDFVAFMESRQLSNNEREQRMRLRASQMEVREAFDQLALSTLQRLDNSIEVAALNQRIQVIQKNLEYELEMLMNIAKIADTVAKVSDSVTKVVVQIAKKAEQVVL